MRGAGFLSLTSERAAYHRFSQKSPTLFRAFQENAISVFMPIGVLLYLSDVRKGFEATKMVDSGIFIAMGN